MRLRLSYQLVSQLTVIAAVRWMHDPWSDYKSDPFAWFRIDNLPQAITAGLIEFTGLPDIDRKPHKTLWCYIEWLRLRGWPRTGQNLLIAAEYLYQLFEGELASKAPFTFEGANFT